MAATKCPDGNGWYTYANGHLFITCGLGASRMSLTDFRAFYGVDALDHIEKEWSNADPSDYITKEAKNSIALGRAYQRRGKGK